jgi:hypothetical protein
MPAPGIDRSIKSTTPVSSVDKFGNVINAPVSIDPSKGKIEAPKSQEILDLEKQLGRELEPIYATSEIQRGSGATQTVEYGPPVGYRYDNGQNQYVNFDTSGQQTGIRERSNLGTLVRDLAPLALTAIGANFLAPALGDLFGAEAGTSLGTGTGAINEAVASGMSPGSFGATALPGSLTPAQIAAAEGISTLGGATTELAGLGAAGTTNAISGVPEIGGGLTTGGAGAVEMGTGTGLTNAGLSAGTGLGAAEMGGGTGLTTALSTSPVAGSALTAGNVGLAEMGGGTGLTALSNMGAAANAPLTAAGTGLASMGGGTGLTTPAAGGGTVGASGVTPAGGTTVGSTGVTSGGTTSTTGTTGTTGVPATTGTTDTSALTNNPSLLKQLQDATGLTGTQLAALLSGGVNAASALNISNSIDTGLDAQRNAAKTSQDLLTGIYNKQLGFEKPYQGVGTNAINDIAKLGSGQYQQYDPVTGEPTTMGTGSGYSTHQFDKNDLTNGLSPNYDFMLQQGQMANQRAANVGGGALSGNTLRGLQEYTQNYAGNAYQNAFTNYQNQRNNIYNNLSNMVNIGANANKDVLTAGTSYGTNVTDLNKSLANATAAAMLGKAQAAGGGANSAANATFLAALLGQGKTNPP